MCGFDVGEFVSAQSRERVAFEREIGIGPLEDAIVAGSAVERIEAGTALKHIGTAPVASQDVVAQ